MKAAEAMACRATPPRETPEPHLPHHSGQPTLNKEPDFEPCLFFFYGTLMDPEVLMAVAVLDHLPEMKDAWIEGFEVKMWGGLYPTLLPKEGDTGRIRGKVWRATSWDQCSRLQRYETSAYKPGDCLAHMGEGDAEQALTFVWAGKPDTPDLLDGSFDLEHWQKNHKTSMF